MGHHVRPRRRGSPARRDDDLALLGFPLSGGAHIERYVPALPLSKEAHAYRRLMRTVGAYRLVFGQPRQEDLLRYLRGNVAAMGDLRIDLSPEGGAPQA